MAHYELYICLTKATYESAVPSVLQPKLGWDEYTYEEDGETIKTTTPYTPTWEEATFKGKLGLLNGELTEITDLGKFMSYPNNSVLTKTEAQTLTNGELFVE